MSVRLVLLGPPGSGKGTLAEQLKTRLALSHLSTGELFRQEISRNTALGKRVRRYVTQGQLVPDQVVVDVMTTQLTPHRLAQGFVLDGFPRTVGQAEGLQRFLLRKGQPLTAAVALRCPAELLVRRLSGRRVCPKCGAIYHVRTMPPRRAGTCDRCATALTLRPDDRPATITKRLAIDRSQTRPLLALYRAHRLLHRMDGAGSSEQVLARVLGLFERKGWAASAGGVSSCACS